MDVTCVKGSSSFEFTAYPIARYCDVCIVRIFSLSPRHLVREVQLSIWVSRSRVRVDQCPAIREERGCASIWCHFFDRSSCNVTSRRGVKTSETRTGRYEKLQGLYGSYLPIPWNKPAVHVSLSEYHIMAYPSSKNAPTYGSSGSSDHHPPTAKRCADQSTRFELDASFQTRNIYS